MSQDVTGQSDTSRYGIATIKVDAGQDTAKRADVDSSIKHRGSDKLMKIASTTS
jgi:hypothetical protein